MAVRITGLPARVTAWLAVSSARSAHATRARCASCAARRAKIRRADSPPDSKRIVFSSNRNGLINLFVVPIIAMRLIAEERKSGTIEILLTSPVTETEVVLGKFLAAWLFVGWRTPTAAASPMMNRDTMLRMSVAGRRVVVVGRSRTESSELRVVAREMMPDGSLDHVSLLVC